MTRSTSDPIPLPEGWVWTTIGEISQTMQYGTSEKANDDPSGIPVVRMGNIQAGELSFDNLKYFPPHWSETAKFMLKHGDVLFNRTNSAELVGKTAVYKNHHPVAVFASYLIRVVPRADCCCPDLLSGYINSAYGRAYIRSVSSQQVGQANVNSPKLASMPFPLPPLPEQHRIVSKIEELFTKLDAGVEELKKAKAQLKRYRQSVLKHAIKGKVTERWRRANSQENQTVHEGFGATAEKRAPSSPDTAEFPELPSGWRWVTLDQLGELWGGGTPSKHINEYWENGSIPWVSPKDMKGYYISTSEDKITESALENSSSKLIRSGSILFVVRSGILRRILPVSMTTEEVAINQDLKALVLNPKLSGKYILFAALALNEHIRKSCMKDGTTVESISTFKLKNYLFPIPPIKEQNIIVSEVEKTLSVVDAIEYDIDAQTSLASKLYQSILKEAYSGKLVPQDPNDEPAEKLLERIRKCTSVSTPTRRKRKSNGDIPNGK